jgi:hypothetical protein
MGVMSVALVSFELHTIQYFIIAISIQHWIEHLLSSFFIAYLLAFIIVEISDFSLFDAPY